MLIVGCVGSAHTAWTASVGSQHMFGRDVPNYPAYSLAVPSLCHTTLQELAWFHPKQWVRWSESMAAVMTRNLLIYSQKLFKDILEPFA